MTRRLLSPIWPLAALILLLAACVPPHPPAVLSVTVSAPAFVVLGSEARALADVGFLGPADTRVSWSSSDETVVAIDATGQMVAAGHGTATVTATSVAEPGLSDSAVVEVIDDPWAALPDLPYGVSRAAAVVVDGLLYVLGGESAGGNRIGRVQLYDPVAQTWDGNLPLMPEPVSNVCAVVLDGDVYVPGGTLAVNTTSTLLRRFDVASTTWEVLEDDPLPGSRFGHACAAHDGRLYLFGGFDPGNNNVFTEPWVYDPALPVGSRWTTGLERPASDGAYGSAVSVGDHIYYAGFIRANPITDYPFVMRYDPADDSWRSLPSSWDAHGGGRLWSDGDRLFLAGGGWNDPLASVEVYDLGQGLDGVWRRSLAMAVGRRAFALAYDPDADTVYAAGGWDGDYLRSVEAGFVPHLGW